MLWILRTGNKMATMAISNNINELDILLQVCDMFRTRVKNPYAVFSSQ